MPGDLGFHHHQHQEKQQKIKKSTSLPPPRLIFKAPRDDSPDSVILNQESSSSSNFSHFSSTSGSVDRCSFASDHDHHQSLVSEISKHLAERELLLLLQQDCSSGPDLVEPTRNSVHRNTHFARNGGEKAKGGGGGGGSSQEEGGDEEDETEEENSQISYPAKNYFSQALKECQDRKFRSEVVQTTKKLEKGRPASLDLNNPGSNGTSPSPRLTTIMKKTSLPTRKSGAFPSPGTPSYNRPGNVGGVVQKGWSSERVPLPTNAGNRRNGGGAILLPFNNNGKTLPSKWEDAEKWIFSPVAGEGVSRISAPQPQRRPKAKSGPLGPPGHAYYSMYSPAMPMFDGRNFGTFMEGSPFSAGIFVSDGLPSRTHFNGGGAGGGESHPEHMEPCIVRSASVHGWSSDLLNRSSVSDSQDAKLDGSKDAATMVSPSVSRRDMATQMSPEGSRHSSPKERSSFSSSSLPPLFLIGKNNCQGESISRPQALMEPKGRHSSQSEVRDVQVDDQVTVTRWSKKHGSSRPDKGFANVGDWRNKAAESGASAWEVAETTKSLSKSKREEAKITAWENLQKAKAEAAIRKLEMKLEKKRSSKMDKIMNKLKSAQKKAQDMRSSVSDSRVPQVSGSSDKMISFRKRGQIGSLSGCFTCHAS